MTVKEFYEWLNTCPHWDWEVTEVMEGVRYVRFTVEDTEYGDE